MKYLRKILLPFSVVYWVVTSLRNLFYNTGIFKSYKFSLPVIAIGNLSTGGTGKTPQTEYLIRLLKDRYSLAVLSRGYRRSTKGFVLADANSTPRQIGDEPSQMHAKFSQITVAVDADRCNGITQLLKHLTKPEIIVLDDAYQHRRLKAGFYILLTAYGDLYADDWLLPAGNLRESCSGAQRANVIVVTKCPADMLLSEQQKIKDKLHRYSAQEVCFTTVSYDDSVYNGTLKIPVEELYKTEKVLVAGIAKPKTFFDYLSDGSTVCKAYPDHHDFTSNELDELSKIAKEKLIVTTEKDYVRLKGKIPSEKLFYLPMQTVFISGGSIFNKKITDYVEQSSGSR
ncbi:tetraacyldisaccharide 4'-kinase [Flavobacterium rhizosphaerae]|uniref:Tetraacyldisaccharide 4'-kinase n=1 Tax=Flavobacterium rhizosphaerae TaxID=3163298 RepID=A0ABW8Z0A5_9FLAO